MSNLILSKEETELVLSHRRRKKELEELKEKRRKCQHKHTRFAGFGHNNSYSECLDCGDYIDD